MGKIQATSREIIMFFVILVPYHDLVIVTESRTAI